MTSNDMVSIIVPAYNVEKALSRSLDSALAQTYSPIEIVIVDDGSSDGTGAVADQYAAEHSSIKVIHQENQGVFKARLNGIQQAAGKWIGFLDADDEMEPEMFQVLMSNALEYGADISHCGYQMVFPSRVDYYHNTGKLVQQDHTHGMTDLLEGSFVEPGLWNKVYRRTLFDSLLNDPNLDTSIKINEDLLMNYYLFQNADHSVFLDRCYYHYVLRANSAATSHVNRHKLEDPMKVLMILEQETVSDERLHPVVLRRIAALLITNASMSVDVDPALMRPFREQARRQLKEMRAQLKPACAQSRRLRLILPLATCCPGIYGLIHSTYARLRGYDKRYEVK